LNLTQRGFDGDFGYNLRSWLTLGGDFSYAGGHSSLLPSGLNSATQAKLVPFLPLLPPGFILAVPFDSSNYTYEAGPRFNYRRLKKVTFFVRPAIGALHANFVAKLNNPIAPGIVGPTPPKSRGPTVSRAEPKNQTHSVLCEHYTPLCPARNETVSKVPARPQHKAIQYKQRT
jgi:hypothetical protein